VALRHWEKRAQQMNFLCARFSSNPEIQRAAEDRNRPLRLGMKGEAIKILQMALIDLGSIMPISTNKQRSLPDGIFGQETFKTTVAFQRLNGLKPDGLVGPKTLEQIDKLLAAKSELTVRINRARGNKGLGS
jgi:murein L,D-transpeptidase YcbB/YkuD